MPASRCWNSCRPTLSQRFSDHVLRQSRGRSPGSTPPRKRATLRSAKHSTARSPKQVWHDAPLDLLWVQHFPIVHSAKCDGGRLTPQREIEALYASRRSSKRVQDQQTSSDPCRPIGSATKALICSQTPAPVAVRHMMLHPAPPGGPWFPTARPGRRQSARRSS